MQINKPYVNKHTTRTNTVLQDDGGVSRVQESDGPEAGGSLLLFAP